MVKRFIKNEAGGFLFETFVALMILSIGITGTLRVFGQSLMAQSLNQDRGFASGRVREFLFEWMAYPESKQAPEGSVTVSFSPDEEGTRYSCLLHSKRLAAGELTADKGGYYRVELNVLREGRKSVFEYETFLYTPKEARI